MSTATFVEAPWLSTSYHGLVALALFTVSMLIAFNLLGTTTKPKSPAYYEDNDKMVEDERRLPPQGHILHTSVTHARLLPTPSKHAFTYPALFLLVSVKALEGGRLDCGAGFSFSNTTTRRWPSILGISPNGYLTNTGKERTTILQRVDGLLRGRRYLASDLRPPGDEQVHDAWMLTMPSLLGWEGINPLTVYFVYTKKGSHDVEGEPSFRFVLLEVHNTFGESHVYVLEVGKTEDPLDDTGSRRFDHQWTFRREFHVSPFNDRSGFYTVAVKRPLYAPSTPCPDRAAGIGKPAVSVHLHTDSPVHATGPDLPQRGQLKLTALLRPTLVTPLLSTRDVMQALGKMPFELVLTMPRILKHAWLLCFRKGLGVYLRPEMVWPLGRTEEAQGGGGVRWLQESSIERYARGRVERFIGRRMQELKANGRAITVKFVPANLAEDMKIWETESNGRRCLEIRYLSSQFFIDLLVYPSASQAAVAGRRNDVWQVKESEEGLFEEMFSKRTSLGSNTFWQQIRLWSRPDIATEVPSNHFLDDTPLVSTTNACVVLVTSGLEKLEKGVFWLLGVRVVNDLKDGGWVGSVKRES
ncbi:hypothetical protein CC1G_09710 [Coprinopsis cinerea okayama7|uniref:Uncharacterized protein n=1 Tax=Coprinopsis cinerea (strain Okayama-7 / 130 / ATCC MYA-4618 / FGSC 9003) TaxID=240176 RepID=A8NJF0_COPC7|nr:hypothetical protein CC1G_09710 [Coprinopsis cinerea okayama7\|eukprot:XP_001834210.2 hypothetical protein CC1G_09710 [Coprinopsis cinerea okayama7\